MSNFQQVVNLLPLQFQIFVLLKHAFIQNLVPLLIPKIISYFIIILYIRKVFCQASAFISLSRCSNSFNSGCVPHRRPRTFQYRIVSPSHWLHSTAFAISSIRTCNFYHHWTKPNGGYLRWKRRELCHCIMPCA